METKEHRFFFFSGPLAAAHETSEARKFFWSAGKKHMDVWSKWWPFGKGTNSTVRGLINHWLLIIYWLDGWISWHLSFLIPRTQCYTCDSCACFDGKHFHVHIIIYICTLRYMFFRCGHSHVISNLCIQWLGQFETVANLACWKKFLVVMTSPVPRISESKANKSPI